MEIDLFKEDQWSSRLLEANAVNICVKPFKWASQEAIILELKVNNVEVKSVYKPRYSSLEISQYFFCEEQVKAHPDGPADTLLH